MGLTIADLAYGIMSRDLDPEDRRIAMAEAIDRSATLEGELDDANARIDELQGDLDQATSDGADLRGALSALLVAIDRDPKIAKALGSAVSDARNAL